MDYSNPKNLLIQLNCSDGTLYFYKNVLVEMSETVKDMIENLEINKNDFKELDLILFNKNAVSIVLDIMTHGYSVKSHLTIEEAINAASVIDYLNPSKEMMPMFLDQFYINTGLWDMYYKYNKENYGENKTWVGYEINTCKALLADTNKIIAWYIEKYPSEKIAEREDSYCYIKWINGEDCKKCQQHELDYFAKNPLLSKQ